MKYLGRAIILFVAAAVKGEKWRGKGERYMETLGPKQDVESIQRIWRNYGARMVAGDLEGYMSQWHHNGIQLPPDGPIASGWESINAVIRDEMSRLDFPVFDVQPQEIRITSDTTAYSWGKCTIRYFQKATGAVTELGVKFLTILVKLPDGSWKIYRDCFNWIVQP
jgi:ketosteroid isomerase-like protein